MGGEHLSALMEEKQSAVVDSQPQVLRITQYQLLMISLKLASI